MTASRTVVIAGAGIGGLTAALCCAAKGFRIVVLEKAERLDEAGAGLQLSPNASRVLIGLGLHAQLAARAIAPAAIRVRAARNGRDIARIPLGEAAAARAGAPYWVMHRADLQAVLLAVARDTPGIELRLGAPFAGTEAGPDGLRVVSGQGAAQRETAATALVGADGVWSAVRRRIFPDIEATFSGRIAWRGTLAHGPGGSPLKREVQLWLGPNAHLVAYPISGARATNLVAITTGSNTTARPDDLAAAFAAPLWSEEARALIAGVPQWSHWPLFTLPDGGAWAQDRIALLGDAAHAMLPFMAQGAGMAIEDAAVLADALATTPDDPAAAFARYAQARRERVARVQRTARRNGRIYHLRGLPALARDLAMQALGGERLLAQQDWVYRWRAPEA